MTTPSCSIGIGNQRFPDAQSEPTLSGSAAKGSRVTFTGDMSGLARGWRFAGPPRRRWIVRPPDNTPAIRAALQQAIDANDQARVALVAAMKAAELTMTPKEQNRRWDDGNCR